MTQPRDPAVFVVIPVFNKVDATVRCLEDLRRQTHPDVRPVVVDGGSTDDTVAVVGARPDATLIADVGEQWWTGATWLGIDHALRHGGDGDYVMLLNNDTSLPPDMIEVLISESKQLGAVVAPVALDVSSGSVVNAGATIDWRKYRVHHRGTVPPGGPSTWATDVHEGRGTLVPLAMIRVAGNVDRERLPHYAADYEFSRRLARHGFPLAVTSRTSIGVHVDDTALYRYEGPTTLKRLWWEATSKRSYRSFATQFTLIDLAGPERGKWKLKVRYVARSVTRLVPGSQSRDRP
jgi:GT2 family glycosyltransferase